MGGIGWGLKVYIEKVYVLFSSPKISFLEKKKTQKIQKKS